MGARGGEDGENLVAEAVWFEVRIVSRCEGVEGDRTCRSERVRPC